MKRGLFFLLFFVALTVVLVFGSCSQDSVVPADNEQSNTSGLISGDISESHGSFEYTTETAGDPDHPLPGPFIVRGKNIHYVDSLGVLSVDFTVEHRCRCQFPEPIGMTFIKLLPPGVTVENPDNGEHGPGASIVFGFENDDGMWTPFEESLPRTVYFGVDPGVSIGFMARIDIGMEPRLGSIGGIVWHDVNEDGILGPGEAGIGGVEIRMFRTDGPEITNAEILWRTVTARDGTYRFDGLNAGSYHVEQTPRLDLRPTTPTSMQVILVESGGEVSDFLLANFGCAMVTPPPPVLDVGDWVEVLGTFHTTGDSLTGVGGAVEAHQISVVYCDEMHADSTNANVWPVCLCLNGNLCGPVTAKDKDTKMLEIMGTPVFFDVVFDSIPGDSTIHTLRAAHGDPDFRDDITFDDVEVGDHICVHILRVHLDTGESILAGIMILDWVGRGEIVTGCVEIFVKHPDGFAASIRVMDTMVHITDQTVIRPKP